ncbi:MAG: NAD(P)H-hydrate epimerase, partial [Calditrichia bacterium]
MTTGKPVQTFITGSGIHVAAITTEQMREVDRIAMEETGPNLFQMMENAGRNLASLTMELSGGSWQTSTIVVLAGTGGNGGGGICAARHLANRGADVRLCLTKPQQLSDVAAFQRKVFQATGGKEISLQDLTGIKPTIIIDAIIGYSLKAAPRGKALKMIHWANKSKAPVLSLDVPSGLDSTNGVPPG